jgi:uncharacterized protein
MQNMNDASAIFLTKIKLVVDANGESRISAEDFAVAILDEAENPRFSRMRFTVGY